MSFTAAPHDLTNLNESTTKPSACLYSDSEKKKRKKVRCAQRALIGVRIINTRTLTHTRARVHTKDKEKETVEGTVEASAWSDVP